MKILLFGGSGQLGLEIAQRARDLNFEAISPVLSELDITDRAQVLFLTSRVKPDVVINCAAYTAVDRAEEDREVAFRVNADGAANVARAAEAARARLLHVSTDYVFGGTGSTPIGEDEPTHPLNVYGESKLAGERAVREILPDQSLIIRTSSLHGARGENFVHTMLRLMAERPTLNVVADQVMSPTWAGWLAEVMLDLAKLGAPGVVHASCAGAISWFEFAAAIQELAGPKLPDGTSCQLIETTAAAFPRPARRPAWSVFDTSRLTALLGRRPIPWQEGLKAHLRDIGRLAAEQ